MPNALAYSAASLSCSRLKLVKAVVVVVVVFVGVIDPSAAVAVGIAVTDRSI